jgi:hypothetical protein
MGRRTVRRPTAKEEAVWGRCLEGLKEDLAAVCNDGPTNDILGTMGTNVEVLRTIYKRLLEEDDRPRKHRED